MPEADLRLYNFPHVCRDHHHRRGQSTPPAASTYHLAIVDQNTKTVSTAGPSAAALLNRAKLCTCA